MISSLAAVEKRHPPRGDSPWTECFFCKELYPCETVQMARAIRTVLALPEREWVEGDTNASHARGYNYGLSVAQRTLAAFLSEDES